MKPAEASLPSDTEVMVKRSFDAPVKLVWRAYMEPDLMRRWCSGTPGWSMPVCEMDMRSTTFSGNSATQGGGIYFGISPGLLEVQGSTFSRNTASDSGGGIYNLGTATLQECTVSGNTASGAGGGIFNGASGTLTIDDSTVCSNIAALGADLYNLGVVTINDSDVCVIGP